VSVARRSDAGGSALRFAPWNNGPSAGDLRHVCGGDLSRAQRMFDLVGALAGLAAFAPARRAARLDPVEVLRDG
jgi:hypothetical protein